MEVSGRKVGNRNKKSPESLSDSGLLEFSRYAVRSLHRILGPTRKVGKVESKSKLPAVHIANYVRVFVCGKSEFQELAAKLQT